MTRLLSTSLLLFVSSLASVSVASQKKRHTKHKHGAHEHGSAILNLVVEGSKVTAQFQAPSESIWGFEYTAKSEADKQKQADGSEKLKASFDKMLLIESAFGCSFKSTKFEVQASKNEQKVEQKHGGEHNHSGEQKHSGEHSEVHAEFVSECQKPLAGAKVNFAFGKFFPGIKAMKIQLLSGEKQTGATIENDKGAVNL